MAIDVLAGPGCDQAGKLDYVERVRQPGDVVISVGRIYESLTADGSIPSSNTPALRLALGLRTAAIRMARERELSGFVLTSNGRRADLDRLAAESGGSVRVLKMTEAQACARDRSVGSGRRAAGRVRGRDQAALVRTVSAFVKRYRG